MHDDRTSTSTSHWALRLVFWIIPIVAGLDKFTNLLTNWLARLAPLHERAAAREAATPARVRAHA